MPFSSSTLVKSTPSFDCKSRKPSITKPSGSFARKSITASVIGARGRCGNCCSCSLAFIVVLLGPPNSLRIGICRRSQFGIANLTVLVANRSVRICTRTRLLKTTNTLFALITALFPGKTAEIRALWSPTCLAVTSSRSAMHPLASRRFQL